MAEDTFYDIHMHAFNLSHPYFRAFVQRFKINQLLTVVAIVSILAHVPIIRRFILSLINKMLKRIRNLLAVMENDIGSFLLVTENCLREDGNPLLDDNGLHIGGKTYQKVVLTPLLMDFGRKGIEEDPTIHYGRPSEKPIVEQVVDVFNAIKKYKNTSSSGKLSEKYSFLSTNTKRVFEIYPFLGLNTKNYDMPRLKKMLDKYFGSYTGDRDDLFHNIGQFDGDIEHLGSNFFAGIKVYPPLGFDPWPDNKGKDAAELSKVMHLYQYCSDKGIPVTAHSSEGGFVAISRKEQKNYTAISKWEKVLQHYPNLKLNLAHFPMQEKILIFLPNPWKPRLKAILKIVLNEDYKNVYVDFSNRAVSDKYYKSLRKVIDKLSDKEKTTLKERILFGSDFAINLMSIESYNKYLDIFSKNTSFGDEEKNSFCGTNPERFLFGKTK